MADSDDASNSTRDAAAVRVFPPAIPLATIAISVGLQRLWPIPTGFDSASNWRYAVGGLVVVAALTLLGGWSVYLLRRDGQSENPWKPTFRVLDRGPFRVTRNPMYLQMLLVCVGIAIISLNPWLLLLTPLCAWLLQRLAILPEEAYLDAKFGESYRAYCRRVRRWI